MDATVADRSETNATPQKTEVSPEKHAPPARSVDKFAPKGQEETKTRTT
jgi:hypothetical protein